MRIIALLSASLLSFAAYTQDLSKGLMAQYCLDGNADDSGPSSNHGVNYGATSTTDRFGNKNSAMLFDGKDDNIVISDHLIPNKSFSFSFWSMTTIFRSHIAFWVENSSNSNRISGSVNYNHRSDTTVFWDVGGVRVPYRLEKKKKDFTTDWEHYVMVYDASKDSTYCYLNGMLFLRGSLNVNIDASNRKLYMGSGNFANYFNGKLDDFRVYNRPLTKKEASMLYNSVDACTTVSTDDDRPTTDEFGIYPNPTTDVFYSSEIQSGIDYSIVDPQGQVIATGETTSTTQFSLEGFSPGLYYIRISGYTVKKVLKL